ncbi:MAG: SMC-Scp complex subunit ScpB [SAR324 cluster bacterium]
MNDQDAKQVIEAVLFSSSDAVPLKQLDAVLGNPHEHDVPALAEALNQDYESTGRTFRIVRIGEGYQLRTLPRYKTWVLKASPHKPARLTPAQLETLAIVAYRQPVTRGEVEHLRGVDASFALRTLLEKRLVRIIGKDPGAGRPILYGTSREFLSLFNLADLKDLPTLADFDLPGPNRYEHPNAQPQAQPAEPQLNLPSLAEAG